MNQKADFFTEAVNQSPRRTAQFFFIVLCTFWQSCPAFLSAMLFLLLVRVIKLEWWKVSAPAAVVGGFLLLAGVFWQPMSLHGLFVYGFYINTDFWHTIFDDGTGRGFYFLYRAAFYYTVGATGIITSLLALLELVPASAHEKALEQLHRANHPDVKEASDKRIEAKFSTLQDDAFDGTLLGLSKYTGKPVVVPDHHVNQIILILGTTGGGKTVTLRRFYQRALTKSYPLIIVDGKPTDDNIAWVEQLARDRGCPFYGFNCGNYFHYDPLSHGGHTELKDKIISLKDEWESDYYRSIAEDYLQTAFEVILKSGVSFDLRTVADCLMYEELAVLVRNTGDERLMDRVKRIERYDRKDITGLRAHLNLLINSELGGYFERNEKTFSLKNVIEQNAVVYFSLPALRFPTFSKVLGKLIINDIKTMVDRETQDKKIFTVFDEFSVFAGEQVLNLVNMGRGKGVHAVFGTQGLADLKKIDPAFESQVLNCVNTLICHRLNDQESAENVSKWVGTRNAFDVTAQISRDQGGTGMGSVRRNKEFIVHPDDIKQKLQPGEAFYITKVGNFKPDKIRVKYS